MILFNRSVDWSTTSTSFTAIESIFTRHCMKDIPSGVAAIGTEIAHISYAAQ